MKRWRMSNGNGPNLYLRVRELTEHRMCINFKVHLSAVLVRA